MGDITVKTKVLASLEVDVLIYRALEEVKQKISYIT